MKTTLTGTDQIRIEDWLSMATFALNSATLVARQAAAASMEPFSEGANGTPLAGTLRTHTDEIHSLSSDIKKGKYTK